MAASGEPRWPPLGRNRWPLTERFLDVVAELELVDRGNRVVRLRHVRALGHPQWDLVAIAFEEPGLALGGPEQLAAPAALAIWLVPEELRPGKEHASSIVCADAFTWRAPSRHR
jgi:hypothetical protein